ncbi:ribonuclease J [Deinococcus soli (ex Cha et al. 2016)]|jgi:ribonuclease J|uniref:Ribonuclease J n=2 Tax=Deinococcus soli (ex Cha et al. 2016) TaxID=1309411 RepID=A0AAE3XEN4_9DEIO|nr:ribonuclease J [Deinococcus soli (ex Cha et al. 2016)]MDR6219069.1 ribonuclease J [Deinococcus soli (ex Cha et al. 2016)]MDR6329318.1 ribonuclease J [Deinococcus soli (ex Cha et al. 2016)]MDR6751978.1 ribonuclease J [Deinococcus soli (ex Cha et al. 2016)]GGB72771.1 ribonuclease J [Deinococcus soli (ex Cha et al. 2016)]
MSNPSKAPRPEGAAPHLEVIPLGGMGEIGKNITAYRYEDEIMVVDAGLAFPESHQMGIDLIIPRIDYLQQNAGLIKGWILTHGHEDHIGGLPYILPRLPRVPVYGAGLTLGLVREKLSEFGIKDGEVDLREVDLSDKVKIGTHFQVEFFRMTHSIPDNAGYLLTTPAGVVMHTGDFKLDEEPSDGKTSDLARIEQAGKDGVTLLLSDSTNAERQGRTVSEAEVARNLETLIAGLKGRVFLTTFASNVHRVQNVINIAHRQRRRVVMEGRSMIKYAQVAQTLGYMELPEPFLASDEVGGLQDQQVLYVCTGSQGQPMSVLSRLAFGNHAKIALRRGDSVILSSNPIPGNEEAVNLVINRLYEIGVDVYYPPNYRVHASGHGSQEELATILNLARPKYFLPWHGEPRHQINHARLAQTLPRPPKRTLIARNGDVVRVSQDDFKVTGTVPAGAVYVDGLGVGDIGDDVLLDRVNMSQEGILIMTAVLHPTPHVEIVSRGFVRANRELDAQIRKVALDAIEQGLREKKRLEDVRDDMYGAVRRFVRKVTGRNPVLIPLIVD